MTPYAFIRALPADLPEPLVSGNNGGLDIVWWGGTKKEVEVFVEYKDNLKFSTAWVGGQKRLPIAQIIAKIRGLKDVP